MNWIKNKYTELYNALNHRNLMVFGLLLLVFLVTGFYISSSVAGWFLLVTGLLQLVGFIDPRLFRIEYAALSLITYPIGIVISTFILGLLYFLVFVPIGLVRNRKYSAKWKESVQDIRPDKMFE